MRIHSDMNNTKEIDVPRHHPDVLPSSSLASDALNTVPVPPASVVMDHNDAMPSECKTSPSLTSAEKAMDHNDAMPTECKTSPPLTSAEKNSMKSNSGQQQLQHPPPPPASFDGSKSIFDLEHEKPKPDGNEAPDSITIADTRANPSELPEIKPALHASSLSKDCDEPATPHAESSNITAEPENMKEQRNDQNLSEFTTPENNGHPNSKIPFLLDDNHDGSDSGTEEEQSAFMKELETFFKEKRMDFKPPKFYGEGLNCIKLWRAVMRLGGYDRVTSCKLWRQVGESFKPPKTCTTVSWTFRGFYEKALLEYERHKTHGGEPNIPAASNSPLHCDNQASKAGRARRDAAERAMKGWHSQRHLDNGEDKNAMSLQKHEKQLKSVDCSGSLKRKKPAYVEHAVKPAGTKASKVQLDVEVVDIGPPADWVKITVQRAKDSFEVYALVPGLLREEVRVQSDPAGRLVISGEPEHPDNPWGVTPFKKVVTLPSRIDPHHTSAVVTLHGQLYVSVPFQR